MLKKTFTEPELKALAQYVLDVAHLCELDEDLDVEIGNDTERILNVLGLAWPESDEDYE